MLTFRGYSMNIMLTYLRHEVPLKFSYKVHLYKTGIGFTFSIIFAYIGGAVKAQVEGLHSVVTVWPCPLTTW